MHAASNSLMGQIKRQAFAWMESESIECVATSSGFEMMVYSNPAFPEAQPTF
jgi:hypothetical protein